MELFSSQWNLRRQRKAKGDDTFLYGPVVVHWLHQSLTYLDRGELMFRVIAELVVFILVSICLSYLVSGWLVPVLIAGLVVHTGFWIFDSTLSAVLQFASPKAVNPGAEATAKYLNQMAARIGKHTSVSGIALFGSLARGQWHARSDLDVRLLRRPGFWNWLAANLLLARERNIALWRKQPLDAYVADDVDFLANMRADEPPIFTLKRDPRLEKVWPDRSERTLTAADLKRFS